MKNPMLLYQTEMSKEEAKSNYFLIMLALFCIDLLFSLAGENKTYSLIIVGIFCLLRLFIWYLKAKPMKGFDQKTRQHFWLVFSFSEVLFCAILVACKKSDGIVRFAVLFFVMLIVCAIVFALSRLVIFISTKRKKDSFLKWLLLYFLVICLPFVLKVEFPIVLICVYGIIYTILISVLMKYKKKQEQTDDTLQ